MIDKDRFLFGTKIINQETNEIGILLYTWTNKFAINGGGTEDIIYATCVNQDGRKYNIPMDKIDPQD